MKIAIRAIAMFALTAAAMGAFAQGYPAKSIRFFVGYAPGGGTDIMARAVAAKLTESLGQQVIVDNRPGANANLAADIAAKLPRGRLHRAHDFGVARDQQAGTTRSSVTTSSGISRR